MSPDVLLADLARRGLRIRAEGDQIVASPREKLTDELRSLIREAKPALLPLLRGYTLDLEQRIRSMAACWRYSPDDLAETLERAKRDPAAWHRAVALDERRSQTPGLWHDRAAGCCVPPAGPGRTAGQRARGPGRSAPRTGTPGETTMTEPDYAELDPAIVPLCKYINENFPGIHTSESCQGFIDGHRPGEPWSVCIDPDLGDLANALNSLAYLAWFTNGRGTSCDVQMGLNSAPPYLNSPTPYFYIQSNTAHPDEFIKEMEMVFDILDKGPP